MTDNVKKFMEIASNESDEFKKKLSKADKAEIIAIAAQKGITLTDADFEQNEELSLDELEAVAGGVAGGLASIRACWIGGANGSDCLIGGF